MDYLEQHNLLTSSWHGSVKGKSTTTAITELTEFICDQLEAGNLVTGVILDFSKICDCLGHKVILKPRYQWLYPRWFESYFDERTQVVAIKHDKTGIIQKIRSKHLPVSRGVPQGSVLGSVLFYFIH